MIGSAGHGIWFWTGAPCSPHPPRRAVGRTWAEYGLFECFHSMRKNYRPWLPSFANKQKHLKGAAPRLFRPMYAMANMEHSSREQGFVPCSKHRVAEQKV